MADHELYLETVLELADKLDGLVGAAGVELVFACRIAVVIEHRHGLQTPFGHLLEAVENPSLGQFHPLGAGTLAGCDSLLDLNMREAWA